MNENPNLQDPPKYELYEPPATGMKDSAKGKADDAGLIVGSIAALVVVVCLLIYGMQDAPIDYYPIRVAPVASATQTPSRLNPVPATARNTPPPQPKSWPTTTVNINTLPPSQQP